MIKDIKKLIVKYSGAIVGYLAELDGEIGFQYDDEWLEGGFHISPFSLPLERKIFINSKDTFGGLYGVFADSLPDGWGRTACPPYDFKRGIHPDRLSLLTRLFLISGQGLGGLNYEPSQAETDDNTLIELDEIAKEVKQILNDETDNKSLDTIYKLGGSSCFARPKAHIKINGEEWIVKFQCHYDPQNIREKEYNANMLAKECGLNVNECRLFDSDICSGYFGAKRFDRDKRGRVHMNSLSSLLETTHRIPNLEYIYLLQVVQRVCVDQSDMCEAYGRMCFNVLYGNKDDYNKNFAFLYDEEREWYRLSQFYDINQTKDKFEHKMTVNCAENPIPQDMLDVARIMKLSIQKSEEIIAKIKVILY